MRLPSGNVTLVFTGVESSIRLHRRLGDRFVSLLDRHRELLRDAFTAHDGAEVEVEGDGSLVAFPAAVPAVRGCAEAQRRVASEPWPSDGVFRSRMGVHTGLAVPRQGGYVALAVHEAARISALGHGGQVVLSPATAELVEDCPDVDLLDLGLWQVPDFDGPIRVHQLRIASLPSEFPPLRARPAERHNLRLPANEFVGRASDLASIAAALREGPLVSLVGPAGVGKTRTAIESGHRSVDSWRDGVWFVDLTAASNAAEIAACIGESLSIGGSLADVVDGLGQRHLLLILDNCEHLTDECASVSGLLLSACPDVAILTTSREPLGLSAEQTYRLAPMAEPAEAAELFRQRARAVDPTAELDTEAVEEVCEQLDHLPIAIELAAARLGAMTVGDLQKALPDRLRLLRSRRRDVDPRHRTLGALLDWSYERLEATEQLVFRRLAVYASSFDLEQAEAAVGCDSLSLPEVLWSLMERSLLVSDPTQGTTRYRYLLTVRDYAESVAERAGEFEDAVLRVARWFARSHNPSRCRDQRELGSLDPVIPSIRHLAAVVADHDIETAQHLAWIALRWYRARGSGRIALDDLSQLVEHLVEGTGAQSRLVVDVLAELADAYEIGGEFELAQDTIDAADHLVAEGHEPLWGHGALEFARALTCLRRGEPAAAVDAVRRAPPIEDAHDRVRLLTIGGYSSMETGDAAAADMLAEALAASRLLGWLDYESIILGTIAENHVRRGNTAAAAQSATTALELAVELGQHFGVAISVACAAKTAGQMDAWTDALSLEVAGQKMLSAIGFARFGYDAEMGAGLLETARRQLGERADEVEANAEAWSAEQVVAAARTALATAARA